MPIPPLDSGTGYLPPGDHTATLDELEEAFGWNYRRRQLLLDLKLVLGKLWGVGAVRVWIDGSFVTAKERPRDVDVLYELPAGRSPDGSFGILHPVNRKQLKNMHRVDLWLHPSPQGPTGSKPLHDFWASDRSGIDKGMVLLEGRC
jgi:hypothetical protein